MRKKILLLNLLLYVVLPIKVKALSVDKNNVTIEKGGSETIDLYVNVDEEVTEVSFTLTFTTYDIPANFILETGLTDTTPNSINHKVIMPEPATGKVKLGTVKINIVNNPQVKNGQVNINNAKAKTINNETINLDMQNININIGIPEPPVTNEPKNEEKPSNLLKTIESDIVDIELKKDVYEYKVNIKKNVSELDLKPIPTSDKYKVEVSSQKISELVDDTITIKVSDNDNTLEYKIKVNTLKDIEEIEKDEEEFKPTYKYKGKWISLIVIFVLVLFVGLILNKKK